MKSIKDSATRRAVFFTIFVFLLMYSSIPIVKADPDWLSGWDYRKAHTITGSIDGAQTDYQVGIKVYYGNGVDGTEVINGVTFGKIYTDSKCQGDFEDINFTKADGITSLDYWMEEYSNASYGVFWVEIDSIPDSPDTVDIYVYYGNDAVSSTSSGDNTFIFFDDFEDEDIDAIPDNTKWTLEVPSGYILIKANPSGSGQVLDVYGIDDGSNTRAFSVDWTDSGEVAISFKRRISRDGDNWGSWLFNHIYGAELSILYSEAWYRHTPRKQWYTGGAYVNFNPVLTYAINTWYRVEYRCLSDSMVMNENTVDYTGGYRVAYINPRSILLTYRGKSEVAGHSYIDNVYVRKLRDPEPEHTSWGSEEETPVLESPLKLFGAGFNNSSPFVSLYWSSNYTDEDITLFEVQNSTDKITWEYLGQNTTTEYHDFQVVNGTERYYRIRACNFTGVSWDNSTFTDIDFEKVYFIEGEGECEDGESVNMNPSIIMVIFLIVVGISLIYSVGRRR